MTENPTSSALQTEEARLGSPVAKARTRPAARSMFDPAKNEPIFYQLTNEGLYQEVKPDDKGIYHSRVLARFALSVSVLWREALPGFSEIGRIVEVMLNE